MAETVFIFHAGVRINMDGISLLADPFSLIRPGLWSSTPYDIANSMILKPHADAVIFTHEHHDHFNLDFTLRLLKEHPQMKVITSKTVQNLLLQASPDDQGLTGRLLPAEIQDGRTSLSLGSLSVTLFPTIHDGPVNFGTEHYAVLIRGTRSILFLGDTKPDAKNFSFIQEQASPDLLLAPFVYLTLREGRKIVFDLIKPKTAAFLHLPVAEGDGILFREVLAKNAAALAAKGKDIIILSESGQKILF